MATSKMKLSRRNGMKAIGIDLGTTYTCFGIWRSDHDRVEIMTNEQGNRTTPSMVAFTAAERLVGQAAMNQLARNHQNTVFDAKRIIGRRFSDPSIQTDNAIWPFSVIADPEDKPLIEVSFKGEKKRFTAEEISSMVLAKVKEIAEKFLKCEVGKAVITVPAYFNNAQRQGTKDAGMIAGFEVMKLLNEPTAAAIAYDLDKRSEKEETVLVYDLGGGTFDVSVLKIKKNDITVKAVAGDTHLGGQDFDNRLVNYIVQECKMKRSLDLYRDSKSLRRLKSRCERAKRELSFAFDSVVDVNDDHCISIGRAKFEHLNMDLFEKTIDIVDKCIHDAGMKKWDIHLVLMVGGSSRIPKVQNMLKDFFNNEEIVHEKVNPDEAVAIGAALHAAVLNGDYTHSFVRDVAPLSLGISVKGEIMSVLIPRNTPIPVTRSARYATSTDNQTTTSVDVFEGERASTLDNLYLNGFDFTDIPSAPKGVEGIEIGMEIDTNGILSVTAEHKLICKKETLRVTAQYGGLMESQIAEMIKEAQQLKLEDISWKEKAVLRNQLDDCIYYTDKLLQAKKLTSEEERNSFQNLLSQTKKWLKESSTDKDKADIEEKISEIRKLHSKLIEYPDKANQDRSKGTSSIFSIFSGWKQSKE